MPARALNLLVFREGRRPVPGGKLKSVLLHRLEQFADGLDCELGADDLIDTLLRAGELECAVADAATVPLETYTSLTDHLAEGLVGRDLQLKPQQGSLGSRSDAQLEFRPLCKALAEAPVPHELWISPPEGFAFYALHPLAFAEVVSRIAAPTGCMAVIGIRSIGTTLSAVTAAAARARGLQARRITVRPLGHPYNRHTEFPIQQLKFIEESTRAEAVFLVVDEGPGLSGSSFLSVAEALEQAGVSCRQIVLACGHEPDIDSFRAEEGPRRARRFRWVAVSSEPRRPAPAEVFIGGGQWRRHSLWEKQVWPACWTSLERLKYLSRAGDEPRKLFKFQGLGEYGKRVVEREKMIAAAGFGCSPQTASNGFAAYPWIAGRPMAGVDLSRRDIERLAAYCAFRASVFAASFPDLDSLQQMASHNLHELGLDLPVALRVERPVIPDGRMQPHEWLLTADGRRLKTDGGGHGDDHFFPGVADIAWDLAGVVVEWRMSPAQAESFLDLYHHASGDRAHGRVGDFVTAYTAFRCAYCMMAANALQGSEEQGRLEAAAEEYAAWLELRTAQNFA